MKNFKPYQVLIAAVLILGTGCKKNLPDSVGLTSSAKGSIQLTSNTGRLIAYDDDDGTGLSNLLSYDLSTGTVSCDHVSGGTVTPVWSRSGIFLGNASPLSVVTSSQVSDPYNEVGGMHLIAYDASGSGHQDYLLAYNPGQHYAALLQPNFSAGAGVFNIVWQSTSGIAGYDLASQYDKIIPFELNGTGPKTALIAYRPGSGTCWVIQNQGSASSPNFVAVVKGSGGIGGFDLKGTSDQLVAVDDNPGNGSSDLICYRPGPGLGYVWYLTHAANSTTFTATYTSHSGLPNFPCNHLGDRIIAFDHAGSGWQNYLLCYSPGGLSTTVVDAISGNSAGGNPIGTQFSYPMNANPYTNNYIGDKIIAFEGNGGSWGYSTLIGYQNGSSVDQIFDLTVHGVNSDGTFPYTRVY